MAEMYVTQAEFARQVGLQRQRVYALTKSGVIPLDKNKRIPLEEGKRILEDRRAANKSVEIIQSAAFRKTKERRTKEVVRQVASEPPGEAGDIFLELNIAKRDLTKAQARLKEYEQRQREGELVETAAVAQEGAALGALVREWMSSAPARYSGYLEMKTQREAEVELKKMMQDLNKLFQSSKYTKEGG